MALPGTTTARGIDPNYTHQTVALTTKTMIFVGSSHESLYVDYMKPTKNLAW